MLFYIRKIKRVPVIAVLVLYLLLFFTLNYYFSETRSFLGKKGYYFVYTACEYLTFSYLMWQSNSNKKFRRLILFTSCFFTLFLIIFYSAAKIKRIDSIPIGIETIFLMIFIVYFFSLAFKNISEESIYYNPSFWLVTGILIYLGFTFFFNILANSFNLEDFKKYFYYSYFGDIIKNILFAVTIVFIARAKSKKNSEHSLSVPYLDMI